MLILLSSSRRKRYRDDILRCLAAPPGTRVQFRYTQDLVEKPIWAEPGRYLSREGLVCSVDLNHVDEQKPCPILALRRVTIEAIQKVGETVAVVLVMGKVALTSDVHKLTSEVHAKSGNKLPIQASMSTDAKGTSGLFFFDVPGEVGEVQSDYQIETWQKITKTLLDQPGYGDEQFFWTVIGMFRTSELPAGEFERLVHWKAEVLAKVEQTLLVHVFHPNTDRHTPRTSSLRLTSVPEIATNYPLDLVVDSPYDIKRWRFTIDTPQPYGDVKGWLRIGQSPQLREESESGHPPEWEIDLPLRIKYSWVDLAVRSVLLGLLVATPGVSSIIAQQQLSLSAKVIAAAVAVAAGLAAAVVANMGIKKAV